MNPNFHAQITAFNKMYGLPVADVPTLSLQPLLHRLPKLKTILLDEVYEADTIETPDELDTLTNLADWLGDIIVYCTSEAAKYGIPMRDVLDIIMASNMSKLGADNLPIIADGKVQKGPNYWKPEPKIKELLKARRADAGLV